MSADLELRQELHEIRLPKVMTVKVSQSSSEITDQNGASREEEDCQTPETEKPSEKDSSNGGEEEEYQCQTPKSPKHMIPKILSCPPAPRKPRKVPSCKRKLFELQFFEVVAQDEIDSFFRQFDENSKRRCLV